MSQPVPASHVVWCWVTCSTEATGALCVLQAVAGFQAFLKGNPKYQLLVWKPCGVWRCLVFDLVIAHMSNHLMAKAGRGLQCILTQILTISWSSVLNSEHVSQFLLAGRWKLPVEKRNFFCCSLQQHLLPVSASCCRVEASWGISTAAFCSSAGSELCLQYRLLSNEACKRGNACDVNTGRWKEQ